MTPFKVLMCKQFRGSVRGPSSNIISCAVGSGSMELRTLQDGGMGVTVAAELFAASLFPRHAKHSYDTATWGTIPFLRILSLASAPTTTPIDMCTTSQSHRFLESVQFNEQQNYAAASAV